MATLDELVVFLWIATLSGGIMTVLQVRRWWTKTPAPATWIGIASAFFSLTVSVLCIRWILIIHGYAVPSLFIVSVIPLILSFYCFLRHWKL